MSILVLALVVASAPSAAWAQGDEPMIGSMERLIQSAAEAAAPWTVAVWASRDGEEKPPALGNPMTTGGVFVKRPKSSATSGTIIDADGLILTSHFNVNGKLKSIKVRLADGRELEATVVGFHQGADIALLKVDAKELPVPRKSPMNQLKVGIPVVAVGRCPDGKGLTVNPGIVSAPARLLGRGVQMDSKMNYGNVGGPLVDGEGRLIGVTCKVDVKTAGSFGQNSGVSFAITWDQLDRILPDLRKGAKVTGTGMPFMGIQWDQEAQVDDGVPIGEVIVGGSAEAGGIKRGDVILEFDGQKTKTFDDLRGAINRKAVGDKVKVRLRRGPEEMTIELTLGERPGD
jgi:S1-C subfamily serine protease